MGSALLIDVDMYLGYESPEMMHLCTTLRNRSTGKKFNLTDKIALSWMAIGLRLGIEANRLDCFEREQAEHSERLCKVFRIWLDNASALKNSQFYPLSWKGLNELLEDSAK